MARKTAFRVGRSRTGLGLFATEPIKKGALIVEYKGRKLTRQINLKPEATAIFTRLTAVGRSTERAEKTSDATQIIRAGPTPRPTR
jgi:hypothetical protein